MNVVDGILKVSAPEGVVTKEILEDIRANKEYLTTFIDQASRKDDFLALPKAVRKEGYPLSSAQKRLYFLYTYDRQSTAYNMPQFIAISGEIDRDRLERAFEALVMRHEMLRTRFVAKGGEVVQCIREEIKFELGHQTPSGKDLAAEAKEFVRPFDLEKDLLIKAKLVTFSATDHLLLIDVHHIACDGVSQGILINDLVAFYLGSPLPGMPLQFKDFAEWQQSEEQQHRIRRQRQFWLEAYADMPEVAELPTDLPRPLIKRQDGGMISLELDANTATRLGALAEEEKLTRYMVLLAVFHVFLGKICGSEDITLGTPVFGRQHADTEGIIGMMVNTLPIRNYPRGEMTVKAFLQAVKACVLACFDNQAYPFEELVDELKIVRDPSRHPLFDVMFIYQNFDHRAPSLPGLKLELLKDLFHSSKMDLTLEVQETDGRIYFSFEYDTNLFEEATVRRFLTFFMRTLEACIDDPDQQLKAIDLTDETERTRILEVFNDTTVERPWKDNILSLFEQQVRATPEKVAVIHGAERVTYAELDERAERLADLLLSKAVRPEEIVMVKLERSIDYFVAVIAIRKIGAIYLPVAVDNPDERVDHIIKDSGVRWMIESDGVSEAAAPGPAAHGQAAHGPAGCINIIYTSGSTGDPKGVMGSEDAMINRLHWGWDQFPFAEDEVCCQKTSVTFVDHIAEMFSPLLKGVPQVILSNEDVIDIAGFCRLLREHGITRLTLVPSLLEAVVAHLKTERTDLPRLAFLFSSGEVLSGELVRACCQVFRNAQLVNIYGSTEVTADVAWHPVKGVFREYPLFDLWKTREGQGGLAEMFPSNGITTPGMTLERLSGYFKNSRIDQSSIAPEAYLRSLQQNVLPFIVNTASPRFIGHMTSALPGYVHDIGKLISQLNQNLVKIETSKAMTFLEREAVAKLHRAFYGLDDAFYSEHIQQLEKNLGVVTGGGTLANITALLAARNRVIARLQGPGHRKGDSIHRVLNETGYSGLAIIGSRLMHYSFRKAMSLMGLGEDNIVYADNNATGEISIGDLRHRISECRKKGLLIMAIIGIAGSTERGNIDNLEEMGKVARSNDIWYHVDAAWGGALIFSDRHKHLLKGIEAADSITFCGHKQLYLPQGISVVLFSDPDILLLNAVTAAYQAKVNTFDTGRFTIEGSRSGLSACLHATLSVLGKRGIAALVDNGIDKAQLFSRLIRRHACFELLSCRINILNYRYIPAAFRRKAAIKKLGREEQEKINAVNKEIQEQQFLRGLTFVSKTNILDDNGDEMTTFRVVLSNPLTTPEHLMDVLKDQLSIVRELYGEMSDADALTAGPDDPANGSTGGYGETTVIGKPIYNSHILILDRHRHLLPVGIYGEIAVSGACLSLGYLNRLELNQEKFIAHPYKSGETLFVTGDRGRWLPDGTIQFAGRLDHQIKLNGVRIEPGEIEHQLQQHGQIKDAVVVCKDLGNRRCLVAYYIAQAAIDPMDIRSFLLERIPFYMIPDWYVRLDHIPCNQNGKKNRAFLQRAPLESRTEMVKAASELERTIVEIWASVLRVSSDEVSLDRTFFEMGGNSFKLVQLNSLLNEATGWDLSIPEMFRYNTINALIRSKKSVSVQQQDGYESMIREEVSGMQNVFGLFDGQ